MMEMHDAVTGAGADGAPISPEAWKRAVYRPPPAQFSVELLSPSKQGGSYSYGMRICPIREDGRSVSSRGSNSEYEVWRRWEDCLWFQDSLELEYERMSRAKRKRLVAGKGVKKNGMYLQDQAASFESLPPGPDPNSVTRNIHDYVPKLTKKGTLFRASQATIDQRYKELQACIDGLFQENVPMLIQELRESRKVTDFFGYWRRDFDLAMKQQKSRNPEKQPRNSISSSVFSTYFSASNPSLAQTDNTARSPTSPSHKGAQDGLHPSRARSSSTNERPRVMPPYAVSNDCLPPPSARSFMSGASSSSTFSRSPGAAPSPSTRKTSLTYDHSSSDDESYPRRGSDGSTASSAGPPSPPSSPQAGPSPYIVPHDMPIMFGHNPEHTTMFNANGLASLPEEQEVILPLSEMKLGGSPLRRQGKTNVDRRSNRNAQIFSFDNLEEPSPDVQFNRMSWQTTTSTATTDPASYLADLDTDLTLPKSPDSASRFPRGSIASFASFMTDSSADAIVPRSPRSDFQQSLSPNSARSRATSNTEELFSDDDGENDLLDSYFDEAFGRPISPSPESRPETPLGELPSSISLYSSSSGRTRTTSRTSAGSDTASVAGSVASSAIDGSISIKVVHNKSIILLRVHRTISFEEMRSKVYDKFVTQENIPLSESFAMAYLPPSPIDYSKPRSRSNSMTSLGVPDLAHMRFIHSQHEWEHAMASTVRGKLTLRAIGDRGI